MVKHLCGALAAAAFLASAISADAADLSMTPIYKARPSAASATSEVNGGLKAEYRPFRVQGPDAQDLSRAGMVTGSVSGAVADSFNDRDLRAVTNDRF